MNLRDIASSEDKMRNLLPGGLLKGETYVVREVVYYMKKGKRFPAAVDLKLNHDSPVLHVELNNTTVLVWDHEKEDEPSLVRVERSDDGVVILNGIVTQ